MPSWTDRLAHRIPSAERLRHIVQLADLPFEPSTCIQKDLQGALSEVLDMLALITAEDVGYMRRGELSKGNVNLINNRTALLTVLEQGRSH